MSIAGWCAECGAHVWVTAEGGCVNGHGPASMSGFYNPDTGQPVTAADILAPIEPPVATPIPGEAVSAPQQHPRGSRLALLADMLDTFVLYPGYTAAYGTDTDITIDNELARASWGAGKKKVEYAAAMKAVEPERTLYFWEIVKEQGSGVSFGGFESESTTTFGTKRWGSTKEKVIGPGGVAVDYTWDYGQTRAIVESVAARHGWTVKTVLSKKKAQY